MGAIEEGLHVLCRCLEQKGAVIQSVSPVSSGIGQVLDIANGGVFDQRDFRAKVSPGASNFCVDNGRLLDVAEDCLSAEEVEEIFLGDSFKFLELFERSAVVPL